MTTTQKFWPCCEHCEEDKAEDLHAPEPEGHTCPCTVEGCQVTDALNVKWLGRDWASWLGLPDD